MRLLPLLALLASAAAARADLAITPADEPAVPRQGKDPAVQAQHLGADAGGTTSIRFATDKLIDDNKFPPDAPNRNRIAGPDQRKVTQRDRDLGQTFRTGAKGYAVGAVYLRMGFSDKFAMPGAHGARVALQFLEVAGRPRLNESGTPGQTGKFERGRSPELDDYLEGETYTPLHTTPPAALPGKLEKGMVLKFALTGADAVKLRPDGHYAFLLLFVDRGKDRQMALANSYRGGYAPDPTNKYVGHGIRREGGFGDPAAPHFRPDLPDDFAARTKLQPGTLGFPDVCTFRDLYFTVTAAD